MEKVPESLQDPKDPHSTIDAAIEDYQSSGIPDKKSTRLFSYLGSAYLSLLSVPLIAFPRLLVVLLGPSLVKRTDSSSLDEGVHSGAFRSLNDLEIYLSKLVGLSFITLSALMVLQTGAIPVTSSITQPDSSQTTPYRQPTIFFSTIFFSLLGFCSWNVGLRFIGATGMGLSAAGLWILLFSGDPVAHGKRSHALFGGSKSA